MRRIKMTDYAIEIQNLTKDFESFKLNNINLNLPKGYIIGLIGENGAGKTTLIKSILNSHPLDGGTISVFGKDHDVNELDIKQEIGIVFDDLLFPETLTPLQIERILKGIYTKWDHAYYMNLLTQFQIPVKQQIKKFSKGMKMKLSIATALAHHPKLLILDEPTSGLDPVVRHEILELFLDFIQDEERTVLFSTHITSDLEKVADYIVFLNKGTVLFNESKDVLLNDYTLMQCDHQTFTALTDKELIRYRKLPHAYEVLFKNSDGTKPSLDDLMVSYIKGEIRC